MALYDSVFLEMIKSVFLQEWGKKKKKKHIPFSHGGIPILLCPFFSKNPPKTRVQPRIWDLKLYKRCTLKKRLSEDIFFLFTQFQTWTKTCFSSRVQSLIQLPSFPPKWTHFSKFFFFFTAKLLWWCRLWLESITLHYPPFDSKSDQNLKIDHAVLKKR